MPIDKKRVLLSAAVAALIAGSGVAQAMGNSPKRTEDGAAKTETSDTHSCGGSNGCGGKNGCSGK